MLSSLARRNVGISVGNRYEQSFDFTCCSRIARGQRMLFPPRRAVQPLGHRQNPWILSLESNDTYTWHQEFSPESVVETGRWWKVTANVIVLLPDSPRSSQRFARLNKKPFRTVTFSGELRTLIDGSSQKSNGEATSGTAGFEASYP